MRRSRPIAVETSASGRRGNARAALLAVLSGMLVVLAFPGFGAAYHLDHLIWCAIVPLLAATANSGWRRGLVLGWTAGMTLEWAGFHWILFAVRQFTALGPVAGSGCFAAWLLYASVPWAILGAALGGARTTAQWLGAMGLWVGVEHYYPRLFPWHLGGALFAERWLVQCADLLGASGLTALVLIVNAALYRVLRWILRRGSFPYALGPAAAVLACAAAAYGGARLAHLESESQRLEERIRVGFVQGAIDPKLRLEDGGGLDSYLAQSRLLLAEASPVDLLVWPEGADSRPFDLTRGFDVWGAHADSDTGGFLLRRELPVPLVTGGSGVVHEGSGAKDGGRRFRIVESYNVQAYVRPSGEVSFYKKNYPIPFGERMPLLSYVPESWRQALGLEHVTNLSTGVENPVMELGGRRFRNLICYEAVLPEYVRRSAREVDFLVNLTEDYWYGRTAHVPQHVSVLVLRAVENRIPLVRCTNAGPSGVIDPTGEFRSGERVFAEERFVRDLVLSPRRAESLYALGGHWFPAAALCAGLLLAVGARRPRGVLQAARPGSVDRARGP